MRSLGVAAAAFAAILGVSLTGVDGLERTRPGVQPLGATDGEYDVPALVRTETPVRAAVLGGACLTCHEGIEDIHPEFALTCVDCHGGDDTATTKDKAHVQPTQPVPTDERVLPRTHDLAYLRFLNPSNLRVADVTCGECHEEAADHVLKSLHSTTTGHLGDGYYENGFSRSKAPTYSVFAIRDEDGHVPEHGLAAVSQVPPFRSSGDPSRIETHYTDLARKACMACHLWSEGRAVDGRVGMDGDYRGEGCAACHVTYADDGRSRSGDPSIDKLEPGHPLRHRFTSKIPTETCTRCHYGDASIGLHFRGMAQLVPGMPAGPEVKGTTDELLNGAFYIKDVDMTPPDVHHQRGMHCIDCHTVSDTMGDGNLYPNMDFAVEIECSSCHGTIDEVSNLTTSRGRRIKNLRRKDGEFVLVSKVTGAEHPVVQAKHVVDPTRPEYNPRAAAAMNGDHGRLECYSCHSGWNVNFFGFHFDRNEQFTQLDLLSGRRTEGRVTTQEKVFATFNQLRLGFNHEGSVATYMVGFSTLGSAHDKDGNSLLHQALPETHAGLSGVTMVPHQVHTTRPEARDCVECHRSPATWGLGSVNFRLTRSFAYALTGRGFATIAFDAKTPARTAAIAELELDDPRALALRTDSTSAASTHGYVGLGDGRLVVLDLDNPVMPRAVDSQMLLADPRRMVVQGDRLYVADGVGGLQILDLENPKKPKALGFLPTVEARSVHVAWPWALIADGPGGLVIADVSDPTRPVFLADLDLNGESSAPNEAADVTALFHYSRPVAKDRLGERIERTPARHMAYVAAGLDGIKLVDWTDPEAPELVAADHRALRTERGDVQGIAVSTVFDIGSAGGGLRSGEREYLYAHATIGPDQNRQQRLVILDVSNPERPERVDAPRLYGGTGRLWPVKVYNAPFLQHFVVSVGASGTGTLVDVGRREAGADVTAAWDDLRGVRDMVFEEFALDRLVDERGRWEKDISHEGCRYLTPEEILRVLRADVPVRHQAAGRYRPR